MTIDKVLALALARKDLSFFVRGAFAILNPTTAYQHAPYIDLVAHELMQLPNSSDRRLVINVPPRHLKSTIASVAYPAWLLGHFPGTMILCASYSPDLALKFSKETRQLMESDWYRAVFPGLTLDTSENAQDLIMTSVNGGRRAVSVNGAITGIGADVIIIDDPQKAADVHSVVKREHSLQVLKNTILTRFNDPSTGVAVLLQQRLHEEDWSGAMLAAGWKSVCLRAIAEIDEDISFGKKVFSRKTSDTLHPTRMPIAVLNTIRKEIGNADFSTQYQQRPVAAGSAILDLSAFGRYEGKFVKKPGDIILHSWDLAYTESKDSNFSVLTQWAYRDHCLLLLRVYRTRLNYPKLRSLILATSKRADVVIIEGGPLGTPLFQELRMIDVRKFIPDYPKKSKQERLMAVRFLIDSGRIWLPTYAAYLPDFLHELANFPNAKNDDQVDSLTMALRWAAYRGRKPPIDWKPPASMHFGVD